MKLFYKIASIVEGIYYHLWWATYMFFCKGFCGIDLMIAWKLFQWHSTIVCRDLSRTKECMIIFPYLRVNRRAWLLFTTPTSWAFVGPLPYIQKKTYRLATLSYLKRYFVKIPYHRQWLQAHGVVNQTDFILTALKSLVERRHPCYILCGWGL